MPDAAYGGLLFIGDPHLAHRVPGFRRDDYPRVILDKLRWCLAYARQERLLPVLLGDLFHYPRDNANWLLCELIEAFDALVLAVTGNHDCGPDNRLTDDDSLSILVRARRLRLLDPSAPWAGRVGGRLVIVGGAAWGRPLPKQFDAARTFFDLFSDAAPPIDRASSSAGPASAPPLVFWVAHHDVGFPGCEELARFVPFEIPGIDVVVNGHIHRPLPDVAAGTTTWLNPGNIARITRSDATRERRPSVLRIDIDLAGWRRQTVSVPHQPFDDVFHPEIAGQTVVVDDSVFVRGLAELAARRTQTGAGLEAFLEQNLSQFDDRVGAEIRALAKEVCGAQANDGR